MNFMTMKSFWTFFLALLPLAVMGQGYASFEAFKVAKLYDQAQEKYEAGNYEAAIQDLNQIMNLAPGRRDIFAFRGDVFFKLGRYMEAKNDYAKALREDPQDPRLYHKRGLAYLELDYYSTARRDFERAVSLDPTFAEAKNNLELTEEIIKRTNGRPSYYSSRPSTGSGRPSVGSRPSWPDNDWDETPWNDTDNGSTRDQNSRPSTAFRTRTINNPPVATLPGDYISVEQVRVLSNATEVTLKVRSPRGKMLTFDLQRPGSPGAFVIMDRPFKRSYKLIGQRGLPAWNRPIKVLSGQSETFVLRFERIDPTHRFIHILEGNREGEEAWNFYDIDLLDQ